MKRFIAGLALIVTFGAAQESPVFRSGTHLVQVNVLVHSKGAPVADLKKDDFVLTDKGKPQKISVFSVAGRADAGASSPQVRLPEDTFTNRVSVAGTASSVTIVLLDRLNTLSSVGTESYESSPKFFDDHALAFAKQHLTEFIKRMDSHDRVALYSLAESLSVLSDFSNDRDRLLEILSAYKATSITDREKVDPQAIHTPAPCCLNESIDRERQRLANLANVNRAQITMAALMSIAAHVGQIPGRKNLVWLTADLPFSATAIARIMGRANIAVYPVDARGLVTRSLPGPTDDGDLVPGGGRREAAQVRPRGQDTMDEIAEDTGGRAFINTNNLADAIRSAVEDSSVTYTLGFYPEEEALDGKFHPLKIHVKDGHVDLRYPKGYFAMKDAPLPREEFASRVGQAIESPLESASIHLVARVEWAASAPRKVLSISASVDLHDLELIPAGDRQKGKAEIIVVQQDAAGRVLNRDSKFLNLELTKENYSALMKSGVPFRELIEAKDGLATVRILVADSGNSAMGSLIIPVSEIK